MLHAVSTTDGKVPPEEKLRLENILGVDEAARIVAEVEASMAPPEPQKAKAKAPIEEIA